MLVVLSAGVWGVVGVSSRRRHGNFLVGIPFLLGCPLSAHLSAHLAHGEAAPGGGHRGSGRAGGGGGGAAHESAA